MDVQAAVSTIILGEINHFWKEVVKIIK